MTKEEIVKKFFDMKAKQMMLKLYNMAYQKIGYTQNDFGDLIEFAKSQSDLETVEEEMWEFVKENLEVMESVDLEEESKKAENKVSIQRQKEISKEFFGKELTIEDLAEKLNR